MSLKHVVQGYSNAALDKVGGLNDQKKKIAEDRLKICKKCDILDTDNMICVKDRGGCGCKMDKKVYAMSASCPTGKWNKTQ